MMRFALVATPAALPDLRPAKGALDGDVIRSRLPLPDAGFQLVDLDPAVDLAEQLDAFFDGTRLEPSAFVLFYASSAVAVSRGGELFLCLDPTSADTGDSLRDIAIVLRERSPGAVAIVLECRHPEIADAAAASAKVVRAAEAAVTAADDVELLVGARPHDDAPDERPSPLTLAMIEALDEADPEPGLTLTRFFQEARAAGRLAGENACFAHHGARRRSFLLPSMLGEPRSVAPPAGSVPPPFLAPSRPPPKVRSMLPPAGASTPPPGVSGSAPPPAPARSTPPPGVSGSAPPPAAPSASSAPPPDAPEPPVETAEGNLAEGEAFLRARDPEGALASYKRALALLGPKDAAARAEVYVRVAIVKEQQDKKREAVASLEKALQLSPALPSALERLIDLNVSEGDLRALRSAEDRFLETIADPDARLARLLEFAARWQWGADDLAEDDPTRARAERGPMLDRARALYESAVALHPDDLAILDKLRKVYEETGAEPKAIAILLRLAELTEPARARAEQLASLGKRCLGDPGREALGIELLDRALESDPSYIEPLTIIAPFYGERQEWGELERAYRTMLERAQRIADFSVRSDVTWELCRRLGLLFRDHLEDPALALDAFEDAVSEKTNDLPSRLTAAELARAIGRHDRAAVHLQAAAMLDPSRAATFHDLFDSFQQLGKPDHSFAAASVAVLLRAAEYRERIVFDSRRAPGVPKPRRTMRPNAWELLRTRDRDRSAEAVLLAAGRAAIAARIAMLAEAGQLPALDPAARQDLQKSAVSIVRSFAWASHYLGVTAPAIYIHADARLDLAAVVAQEECVVAGGRVLRGRDVVELAFLAGRQLAYHDGSHRLLLYYPTLEELSNCFLAALKIALPDLPLPPGNRALVLDLTTRIESLMEAEERIELQRAVRGFKTGGGRTDIAEWVGAVERCATRVGYLLAGDLEVVARVLRTEPSGVLSSEEKIGDLVGFTVSEEYHVLRAELGIALRA
jgi:cellulose synthase operon protein C